VRKIDDFIIRNGISLLSVGVKNFALNRTDVLKLLRILEEQKVGVFGGGVYASENGKLSLTYDNWYTNRDASESDNSFSSRSISRASDHITSYAKTDAFFALTLDIRRQRVMG